MHRNYNFDALMEFHDGLAAISSDGAGVVASAAATKDVGAARFEGVMVIDVSAADFTTGDETYDILIRGSAASNMGSPAELASIKVIGGTTGRIELPFCNVKQGTVYRYLDIYVDVAGTSPSITFTAFADRANCWG